MPPGINSVDPAIDQTQIMPNKKKTTDVVKSTPRYVLPPFLAFLTDDE